MPRRSNEFQRLVRIIEEALAPVGFTVEESVMVEDRLTGEPREVDILVSGEIGAHRVAIAVEVIGRGRPASVEWVDQMVGKHLQLRHVDKLVLVSQAGFYRAALEKARELKIETFTFKEALHQDWTRELDALRLAEQRQVLMPVPVNIGVELEQPPPAGAFSGVANPRLEAADGTPAFTASDWAWYLVQNYQIAEFMEENAKAASSTSRLVVRLRLEDHYVIDGQGGRHKLRSLVVDAVGHIEVASLRLERRSFGDVQVAIGSDSVLGERFQVAAVQRPHQPIQVRWDTPGQLVLELHAPALTSPPVAVKEMKLADIQPIVRESASPSADSGVTRK